VEAGRTILLDRELMLKKAEAARIAVVGVIKPDQSRGA
jgi:DUF1009 family protein